MVNKEKNVFKKLTAPLKLSLKERKIIYLLRLNSRMPISEMAKRIGCSRELAQYTLKRLIQKKKVVSDFFPIVDYNRLGYVQYYIFVKFKNKNSSKTKQIIREIEGLSDVHWVGSFFGSFDITIRTLSESIFAFDELFSKIKSLIAGHYMKYTTARILERVFLPIRFLLNEIEVNSLNIGPRVATRKNSVPYHLSQDQKALLTEVMRSPRASLVNLSKQVKRSYRKTQSMFQGMIADGIIQDFMCSPRFSSLRFEGVSVFEVLVRFNSDEQYSKKTFEEFMKRQVFITSYAKFTACVYDYLLWIYTYHIDDLEQLLGKMSDTFPENLEIL